MFSDTSIGDVSHQLRKTQQQQAELMEVQQQINFAQTLDNVKQARNDSRNAAIEKHADIQFDRAKERLKKAGEAYKA